MQSHSKTAPGQQMQHKIKRIFEGVLMLGGALVGIWLLAAMATFFFK